MQVSSYLFQSPYSQSIQVGRPDPAQEQKQTAEEEAARTKATETEQKSAKQKEDQAISVKSSTMYQSDSASKNTTEAVNAFMDIAKNARRSQYVNTYNNS
ncbi:MAG: hypothetical protein QG558_553 [Campylobacterota bacterium]|nr:hypothetical protein [Campylobacterota bacterium]